MGSAHSKTALTGQSQDWFQNRKEDWKKNWEGLAETFYNEVSATSLKEHNQGKHALVLASSNRDASGFFKGGLKKPTKYFSLILGTSESTLDRFNESSVQDSEDFSKTVS